LSTAFPSDNERQGFDTGPAFTGHEVLDENSQHVGKVTDVIYDDPASEPTVEPTWLVVDPGLLRAPHYVPVAGSYRTEDGAIVVPWNKEWIKTAVKASGDHILTAEEREELQQHYTMA
jgi:hypothetical protein